MSLRQLVLTATCLVALTLPAAAHESSGGQMFKQTD